MEGSFSILSITSAHFELLLQRDICIFAENIFGNLCNESFLLLFSVTEVTFEVFNLKLEMWLHRYSYWRGEQVNSRNEIYPEKKTALLDFALQHFY